MEPDGKKRSPDLLLMMGTKFRIGLAGLCYKERISKNTWSQQVAVAHKGDCGRYLRVRWHCEASTEAAPSGSMSYAVLFVLNTREKLGCVVAQADVRASSLGICGGQDDAGVGFLWVLRLPLPVIHGLLRARHHVSPGVEAVGHIVAHSGHSLTQP
jgi:hypothetical protein